MKSLILKNASDIVIGDVFFVGFSVESSFLVQAIEKTKQGFKFLLQCRENKAMTGYEVYPASESFRMNSWED